MDFLKVNSDYTSFLPQEITTHKVLSLKISAAIRVLQNLSQIFEKNLTSINTLKNSIENKRLFIREMAESMCFSNCEETFHKTCEGHNIRLNSYRYNSKKKASRKAKKCVEELKKINDKHPILKEFETSLQKQGHHYDIRLKFVHYDNIPICNYPAILQQHFRFEPVLNVLDQFENVLNQHQINLETSYGTLIDLVFQNNVIEQLPL